MALFQHYRTDLYPGSGRDSFYAGCHDSPAKITGDCYTRCLAQARTIGTRQYTIGAPKPRMEVTDNELTQTRKAAGLTQSQLGARIGVCEATIRRFERGELQRCVRTTRNTLGKFYGEQAVQSLKVVRLGEKKGCVI